MASKPKPPADLLTNVPPRKPAGAVPTTKLITLPDEAAVALFKGKVDYFMAMVRSMPVTNAQEYQFASGELRSLLEMHKEIDASRQEYTVPLNAELDAVNAVYMPLLKLLRTDTKNVESAESIIKAKMAAFQEAEAKRAREEQRRAEEAAEAERRRLAAEAAEVRRKAEEAAEAIRKAEEARRAEAAAAQKLLDDAAAAARSKKAQREATERAEAARLENARRAAEAEARAAEAAQHAEEQAQATELAAAVVIAQPVAVPVTKAAGIVTTKSFDFEVTDLLALAKHVVEKRPDLVVLLATDAVKIRAHVKTFGENAALPGLRVFVKSGITVR